MLSAHGWLGQAPYCGPRPGPQAVGTWGLHLPSLPRGHEGPGPWPLPGHGGWAPWLARSTPSCWPAPPLWLLQVAAKALEMGVFGAYFNVLVNLTDIADDEFKEQVSRRLRAH